MTDHMAALNKLRRLPENKLCGTCFKDDRMGYKDVCMKFKIFVCSDCKSAHQAYSHRCKSVTMSNWSKEEVEILKQENGGGNAVNKATIFANLPPNSSLVPKPGCHPNETKEFVQRAYNEFQWHDPNGVASLHRSASDTPPTNKEDPPPVMSAKTAPLPVTSITDDLLGLSMGDSTPFGAASNGSTNGSAEWASFDSGFGNFVSQPAASAKPEAAPTVFPPVSGGFDDNFGSFDTMSAPAPSSFGQNTSSRASFGTAPFEASSFETSSFDTASFDTAPFDPFGSSAPAPLNPTSALEGISFAPAPAAPVAMEEKKKPPPPAKMIAPLDSPSSPAGPPGGFGAMGMGGVAPRMVPPQGMGMPPMGMGAGGMGCGMAGMGGMGGGMGGMGAMGGAMGGGMGGRGGMGGMGGMGVGMGGMGGGMAMGGGMGGMGGGLGGGMGGMGALGGGMQGMAGMGPNMGLGAGGMGMPPVMAAKSNGQAPAPNLLQPSKAPGMAHKDIMAMFN
ncbi:hypothetical protein AB1Y20_000338 [Prymnesium parvum]|uniref:Arf-GAP domain-containing protein n=1 Tax=Prymnesium parvum TaxID=97485 RepID=A0AB34K7M9_PRYPA